MCSSLPTDCRKVLLSAVSVIQANQAASIPVQLQVRAGIPYGIRNCHGQDTVRAPGQWAELSLSSTGGCVRTPGKVAELEQYWRCGPIHQPGPGGC